MPAHVTRITGLTAAMLLVGLAPVTSAAEEPTREVTIRSTGRPVSVEVRVKDKPVRCQTPCKLRLPPGSHRARIDGLDRRLQVGEGDTAYTVEPTRRGLLITGLVAAGLGGTGLSLGGSPWVDLDKKTRLIAALGGLALMGLAVPLVRSSSATLTHGKEEPRRRRAPGPGHGLGLELEAGAQVLAGSTLPAVEGENLWRMTLGASYYLADWGSVGLRSRLGGPAGLGGTYEVQGAARAHYRVPLVYLLCGIGGGYAWGDAIDAGPVLEAEAGLRLALSRWVAPTFTVSYRAAQAGGWSHGLLLGGGLAVSF